MQHHKKRIYCTCSAYILLALSVIVIPLKWLISCILAIAIHECAHLLLVFLFRGKVNRICFTALGARIETDSMPAYQSLLATAAGPAASMLLMLLHRRFPMLVAFGFIHGIINLLPMKNLDGGHILQNILCIFCSLPTQVRIANIVDLIVRFIIFAACFMLIWYIRWGVGMVLLLIVLIRGIRNIPCKDAYLPVQ